LGGGAGCAVEAIQKTYPQDVILKNRANLFAGFIQDLMQNKEILNNRSG
jgi:hypothetical protein